MTVVLNFQTNHGRPLDLTVRDCVVAGWTGRDKAALDHHIEELAALGIPGPSHVPLYYRAAAGVVTQAYRVQVLGGDSSGEVEPVLISADDGLWLTVGSDHTDRKVEAYSIPVSKQMCPKVLARDAWKLDEVIDRLDELILEARVMIDGAEVVYQTGTLAMIRPLMELVDGYGGLPSGTVMLCGTVPVTGGIRPADRFAMRLSDPKTATAIDHAYDIETLPVVT